MKDLDGSFLKRLDEEGFFKGYGNLKLAPNGQCRYEGAGDWHGTAIFAFRYEGGVIFCSDRRATNRNLDKQDDVNKIFPIGETAVLAVSGALSLGLLVARILKIEVEDFSRKHNKEMSTEGKAQRASRVLDQFLPMMMSDPSHSLMLGGILVGADREIGETLIYRIFPFNPLECKNFAAEGSGGPNALDVIKDHWRNDLSRQEALSLATRALRRAYDQNAGVGKEPTVYDITGNGPLMISSELAGIVNPENGG